MSLQGCTLTYFNFPGRAEAIRIALTAGDVKFTDKRIEFKEWPEFKMTTPWETVPTLALADGSVIAQSRAALRYVCKEVGLYPTDALLAARCDEVLDVVEEIVHVAMKVGVGLPAEEKAEKRKEAMTDGALWRLWAKLDSFVAAHGANGFAIGSSFTMADLAVAVYLCNFTSGLYDGIELDSLDTLENLMKVTKNAFAQAAVKKWFAACEGPLRPSFQRFLE